MSREPIAISEQPKTEFSRSHGRRFALIGATMIGTVAILWIGGASLVAYQLTHPPFLREGRTNVYGRNVPTSYDGLPRDPREAFNVEFDTIRVPVSRDRAIDGWLTPGRLPAAVLLVPPVGGSRRMMLPYAKFLHEAGYPTLAIDSGADANSGITWGWRERMAVLSAASELRRRGFEQRAALGVSEGAAEILLVQAAGASFAAIVADSSYGNLEKMFRRVPSIAGLNPALRQTALWETGLLIGHPLWKISPEQAAANLGATPLLVIQNRDDKIVPLAEGEAIARAAADQGQLWVVQADGHGDAIYAAPEEYASRVLAFLGGHIVTESSERK